MKKILTRGWLYVLIAAAIIYAADALLLRFRREPYGAVTIQRYYALHKDRQKTNYMFAEPEAQTCVHSLLPHSGHPPCWYLSRHAEQRIDYD
ncbi:MAG: hypothetical protein ACXVZR_15015 [Terriglobales bacterium]